VLALVSLPSYDPNDPEEWYGPNVRLKPVTSVFQSGPLLQPFLLFGALSAQVPNANALADAFAAGRANTGQRLARSLGLDTAQATLMQAGLFRSTGVEIPGEARPLVRVAGPNETLLKEIGEGSAVAPTLLVYASSLAALLEGSEPGDISLLMRSASSSPHEIPSAATREVRDRMVERARHLSGDSSANFGGLWSTYRERVEGNAVTRNIAAALFAPADEPRYLVVLKLRVGTANPGKDVGLRIATDILRGLDGSVSRAPALVLAAASGDPRQQYSTDAPPRPETPVSLAPRPLASPPRARASAT
jgi:hypothetical protein